MTSERWRQAFLDEAYGGDEQLRHRVQSLLVALPRKHRRSSCLGKPWRTLRPPSSSEPSLARTASRAFLARADGRGYGALDTKLNRTVAVKLLSSDLADATPGAAMFKSP